MKHLIIGAGATLAEALDQGNPPERCPPLLRDFARKMWPHVYNPHPVLEAYLRELGYTNLGPDPRELFYRLEDAGQTNIERFLEFAWIHRHKDWKLEKGALVPDYISGLRLVVHTDTPEEPVPELAPRWWADFLYNGIGKPLTLYMSQCFFENGVGWKNLRLTKSVASHLDAGDLVLNLNYDTVFELALDQLSKPFAYCPNPPRADEAMMCKPHGSLNMVMNAERFAFGQPDWLGMPEPPNFRSYSGFIAPRLNKSYAQHPASEEILAPAIAIKRNPGLTLRLSAASPAMSIAACRASIAASGRRSRSFTASPSRSPKAADRPSADRSAAGCRGAARRAR